MRAFKLSHRVDHPRRLTTAIRVYTSNTAQLSRANERRIVACGVQGARRASMFLPRVMAAIDRVTCAPHEHYGRVICAPRFRFVANVRGFQIPNKSAARGKLVRARSRSTPNREGRILMTRIIDGNKLARKRYLLCIFIYFDAASARCMLTASVHDARYVIRSVC